MALEINRSVSFAEGARKQTSDHPLAMELVAHGLQHLEAADLSHRGRNLRLRFGGH